MNAQFQAESGRQRSLVGALLTSSFGLLTVVLAAMWFLEGLDSLVLDDRLQSDGILPRRLDGLDGVLWAPFLHVGWAHLIGNTVPFLVLGGLVAVWGMRRWLAVSIIVILIGGGLTWLLGRNGNHVGASGLIFGYFGFLVGAVFFERKFWPILPATVAVVLFGSAMVTGFIPTGGVSWEGHVFGAAAGVLAARITSPARRGADLVEV